MMRAGTLLSRGWNTNINAFAPELTKVIVGGHVSGWCAIALPHNIRTPRPCDHFTSSAYGVDIVALMQTRPPWTGPNARLCECRFSGSQQWPFSQTIVKPYSLNLAWALLPLIWYSGVRKIRHGAEGRVIKICRFDRLAQRRAGSDGSGQRGTDRDRLTYSKCITLFANQECRTGWAICIWRPSTQRGRWSKNTPNLRTNNIWTSKGVSKKHTICWRYISRPHKRASETDRHLCIAFFIMSVRWSRASR